MKCTTNNLKYTNTKNTEKLAKINFKKYISKSVYPGRGIVIGKNKDNSWILIYWIMGRSFQSRNRLFKYENKILRTEAFDPSLIKDPKYIIYNAMRDEDRKVVISNGNHTDIICKGLIKGESFFKSLESVRHELDPPNYTPRIAGLLEQSESTISLAKICQSNFNLEHSSYHFYRYPEIQPGFGYCITTYSGNSKIPTNFHGDPILLKLDGNIEEIAKKFWNELNYENKVSLFTREIKISGEDNLKIINSCR